MLEILGIQVPSHADEESERNMKGKGYLETTARKRMRKSNGETDKIQEERRDRRETKKKKKQEGKN